MFQHLTQFFIQGGLFMVPLVICSVTSLSFILERAFALRRANIIHQELLEAVEALRFGEQTTKIEQLSASRKTTLDRLVRSCLQNAPWSKFENTETLQTKARAEVSHMDKGLVILEIIVGIGPLLGLLGTVSGLIAIFSKVGTDISSQGIFIARGISEALNTTVAGLVVAIPSLIAYSIFTRRVDSYAVELETICVDLLGKLYTQSENTES